MGLPILFLRNLQSVRSSIWICTYDSFLVNLPRALILPVQGRVVNQFYFKSGQVLRNNFKVPGIGAARRKALLGRCGSIEGILAATPEELAQTPGVPITLAQTIQEALE